MPTKTKKDLGRISLEQVVSRIVRPGRGESGSRTSRFITNVPGEVSYSPYTVGNWKRRIELVQDATTTMIGKKLHVRSLVSNQYWSTIRMGDSLGEWLSAVNRGDTLAALGSIPTSAPGTNVLAQAIAAEKFLADYYDKTRSIRGASSLAEFASTVRGLASPAKALRKEVGNLWQSARKAAYRNSGRSFRDGRKAVAGTWLEWQFGMKPLIDDVNGAADALNRMGEGDFRISLPIRGSHKADRVTQQTVNHPISSGTPFGQTMAYVDHFIVDDTICTIRGAVTIDAPFGEVPPAMLWGLTSEDLLPGVLEAIPWSWMFDYFFNISSVIEAYSFVDRRLGWCNRTVRNSRTWSTSDIRPIENSTAPWNWQIYTAGGGASKAAFTTVIRSPVLWRDVAPVLRMRVPGIGSTKWANLGAVSNMYNDAKRLDAEWYHLRRRNGKIRRPNW